MKVCLPGVAWVGVDPQNRAVQAASVECRTEILLGKCREGCLVLCSYCRVSPGSRGVDPDVLVARNQNHDLL
ncbi:hypothetical protein KI387_015110, partial [Taxus chinensis]